MVQYSLFGFHNKIELLAIYKFCLALNTFKTGIIIGVGGRQLEVSPCFWSRSGVFENLGKAKDNTTSTFLRTNISAPFLLLCF